MSEIAFVAKLRDAAALMVQACNDYLNQQAPDTPQNAFDKLPWKTVESQSDKGPYEQVQNDNSEAFMLLQRKLKDQNSFWKNKAYQYWFHRDDPNLIDRRQIEGS